MSILTTKISHQQHSFLPYGIPGLFIFLIAALTLYANYPGYMNPDSISKLNQIYSGNYNDWHAPFVTLAWSVFHTLLPGPFGFIVLTHLLIWGSLAALFYPLHSQFRRWALLVFIIPFLPGALNFLGNVHKDALLAGWLLLASILAHLAHLNSASLPQRITYQSLANILLLFAFLTRSNAIFAILPILFYANAHIKIKYNVLISFFIIILMPVLSTSILKLTNAHSTHPGDSVKTYHLLGLSYLEGRNLFPGQWTEEQTKKITESCYTPVQWDSAALWGKCSFIHESLLDQGLWGSSTLTKTWVKETLGHPLSTLTIMSATFYRSLLTPNSKVMFYKHGDKHFRHWEVKTDPPRLATQLLHRYVNSTINDYLGRPWFFAGISMLGLVIILKLNLLTTAYGLFAFISFSSGLVYLLSYLLTTVSAEFRYFYWSGISAYLGAVMLFFAWRQNEKITDRITISAKAQQWLSVTALSLVAITGGIVLAYQQLPPLNRTISITPLEDKPVALNYLRKASTPNWMGLKLGGTVEPHQWTTDVEGVITGTRQSGTLTTTIATFGQAIEVGYKTGPEYGKALVNIDEQTLTVNLAQPVATDTSTYLWQTPDKLITNHYQAWLWPVKVFIFSSLILLSLLWFSKRKPAAV